MQSTTKKCVSLISWFLTNLTWISGFNTWFSSIYLRLCYVIKQQVVTPGNNHDACRHTLRVIIFVFLFPNEFNCFIFRFTSLLRAIIWQPDGKVSKIDKLPKRVGESMSKLYMRMYLFLLYFHLRVIRRAPMW